MPLSLNHCRIFFNGEFFAEFFLRQFCDAHACSGGKKPFSQGGKVRFDHALFTSYYVVLLTRQYWEWLWLVIALFSLVDGRIGHGMITWHETWSMIWHGSIMTWKNMNPPIGHNMITWHETCSMIWHALIRIWENTKMIWHGCCGKWVGSIRLINKFFVQKTLITFYII